MSPGRAIPDAASELIRVLAEDQDWTSVEIAETLWLALQMEPATSPQDTEDSPPSPPPFPPSFESQDISPDLDIAPLPDPEPIPRIDLATSTPQAGVLPPQTLPIWLADPAMLTDSLEVIRALKPLLQKVDAGAGKRLDESATVDTIARTQLCLPVLEPRQEAWFDIILVVDRGPSMAIWQRLIKDVVRILRRYGAFRDVRVFDLTVNLDASKPENQVFLISNPKRPGHRPSELIDQKGRRIAIVLSDCAGKYWWNGTLLPMLQDWGATMPTVVWQMLPAWMWKRTALGRGTAVAVSNDWPGGANQRLKVQIQEREEPPDNHQRLSMPVITSEIRDLSRWSLMVAGDRREVIPGFLLPQTGGTVPRTQTYEQIAQDRVQRNAGNGSEAELQTAFQQALEALARERVERFLNLASPEAQRLIMLLAAAPVITLPVVRLIRDAMLPEVRTPLPVAEVFLSGLLQRLPNQEPDQLEKALAQQIQPEPPASDLLAETAVPSEQSDVHDLVQYDFAPRVRSVLLEFLPAVDTIEVINSVSAAVERRWNQVSDQDFQAFLRNPNLEVSEELSGLRSFANITADILEQLGGEYRRFAQDFRGDSTPPEEPPAGIDPDEFPLEDIEYEVAEYLNFPAFEAFEFSDAQFDITEFPPPLQPDEFEIFTVELPPTADPTQDLEPFEFTVATLHRRPEQESEWEIHRHQQQAYRWIEPLPDEIFLEMVAIPAGSFLMGSPVNEPEREDNESPQHEVTVNAFLMGRYPVTQAQWRVVARMPQVERRLKPNPSRFKGDDRPVERVTWYDAVEFCARLSAHTGRSYRLPTEAEWEYACRAGTTTPFHFGETMTTEVANYNGLAYADGPAGESRGATTPIDHFEIANAFGLSDMHGNVLEWCQDPWHNNYKAAPTDGSAWMEGGNSSYRVLRGGSWGYDPWGCRSACRNYLEPGGDYFDFGFRVCCASPRILP